MKQGNMKTQMTPEELEEFEEIMEEHNRIGTKDRAKLLDANMKRMEELNKRVNERMVKQEEEL
jgi:predicted transglutaminase-like cysteine proteinase